MYDPFILAQQAEQVYYTLYPKAHQDWLGVIKIKARSAITDNVVRQGETETPYQDVHEINGIQINLQFEPEDFNDLADPRGVDEVVYTVLPDQYELNESSEDIEYISSDDEESESEFSDRDSN